MKIAFDVQSLFEKDKTGIGWTVKKMMDNIVVPEDAELQLNFFCLKNRKQKEDIIRTYLDRGFIEMKCGYFSMSLYRRLWNYIPIPYWLFMKGDQDITQFFNYVLPPGVKGKTSVYVYDMVYRACPETMNKKNRRYMERNAERSCKMADIIITISEFSKSEIVKYLNIDEKKIHVVPCGVDLDVYNRNIDLNYMEKVKKKFGIEGPYYLYLGTLEPRKNIPLIIDAYYQLTQSMESSVPALVIAGKKGWEYDKIFQMVQEYKLEKNVIFTGYVSEKEKKTLLQGAVCFLFPSLYEGFGIPPLEAMASGTPVIVSDRASLPEVVGDAGILVDAKNCEELAHYMKKLYENDEYRKIMIEKGIDRANLFSWKKAAEKLMKVYRNEV